MTMFIGLLSAIVLVWELMYFTGLDTKVSSIEYLLVNGLILGGLIYLFKSERIPRAAFVRRHAEMFMLLGVVACVQSAMFLALYLFAN